MIPPSFGYSAPRTLPEAVKLLVQHGDDAKIFAGGHSLLPMMKLRFALPGHLIDINRIPELKGIREEGGLIKIGAMTTENELIDSTLLQQKVPLLPEAARQIADPQVRNCGTIGGDIAHGDPGNDHPAIVIALDATLILTGPKGQRSVAGDEFLPRHLHDRDAGRRDPHRDPRQPLSAKAGSAYCKLKRKTGDWATAAAAVVLRDVGWQRRPRRASR